MKKSFREQHISEKRMKTIYMINKVLEDYGKQGYRLTLRQLYYQLVAKALIPNKVQEYAKLSSTLVIARMNGLTDWNMIEDRTRRPHLLYSVHGIDDAIQDTIDQYRLNRQKGQQNYIEIWTEKDAVSNILKRVSEKYHIKLVVNKGYTSCSAMYEAYNRLKYAEIEGQFNIVLYVGDHDPSGLDMLRDIRERLKEFGVKKFSLIPVALTYDQIEEFNPPPNPAKITDPRAKWYIEEHGNKSWELDALQPSDLERIVKKSVLNYLNLTEYNKMVKKEESDKKTIEKMMVSEKK